MSTKVKYCLDCALRAFKIWQGWIPRDMRTKSDERMRYTKLPKLSSMVNSECAVCGSREPLQLNKIFFQNIHGPYSTGLPDHFVLKYEEDKNCEDAEHFRKKFGVPYDEKNRGVIELDDLYEHLSDVYPSEFPKKQI